MKWISTDDSLPPTKEANPGTFVSDRVLVWYPGLKYGPVTCYFYTNNFTAPYTQWIDDEYLGDLTWRPTHWMPLPEPPKS